MTTRARLEETVEQYRVRQERAAEGCVTFRSDRGDDARKLLALVEAYEKAAPEIARLRNGDPEQNTGTLDRLWMAAVALTTDPEARDV